MAIRQREKQMIQESMFSSNNLKIFVLNSSGADPQKKLTVDNLKF